MKPTAAQIERMVQYFRHLAEIQRRTRERMS